MNNDRQCDGMTRRQAIRVGMLGVGGLTLSQYLRLADAGHFRREPSRSAIFIDMPGGPSHLDTFDMKPDAPREIRGEFQPIQTNVPGIEICEHLPGLAKCADKFSIVRGVSHSLGAHRLGQQYVNTGNRPLPSLEFPCFGSVVSRELPADQDLPPFVAVPNSNHLAGFLGVKYAPLNTNEMPRAGQPFRVRGISLADGMTVGEVTRRHDLLQDLDTAFKGFEKQDQLIDGLDGFSQKAYSMLTSRRTRDAFDISKEPDGFRQPFGTDPFGLSCLLALRLIESGIRFVTLTLPGWDTHTNNFGRLKETLLPRLDTGLAALLGGLHQRGLSETTTVMATGEFGRTPKINSRSAEPGRDHYPRCMFMLMAGAGIRCGQVVGKSNAEATGPAGDGLVPDDVAATFYRALGIDHTREYQTTTGRPVMIVRHGSPIGELLS